MLIPLFIMIVLRTTSHSHSHSTKCIVFFFRKMQISSAVCWADSLKDVKEKIFAFDCSTFFKIYIELFQPIHAIIIKAWVMPVERAVT